MIYPIYVFYFSIISAALLLSVLGLWFTAIVPGMIRWSRRFFLSFFTVFVVCCVAGLADMVLTVFFDPGPSYVYLLALECLMLSLPLPMLTVYLLHCSGDNIRRSRLLHAVSGLWAVFAALIVSVPFIDGFLLLNPDNQYVQGPLYPILLLPLIAIQLLNLIGAVKRRDRLSRKVYISFLISVLPVGVSLAMQLFTDAFPLIDISYVISALAMFALVLSDQRDQDLMRQREIANQRASIMVLQMRPHFIYNTLMSIYSLINQDPRKARQVTKDFTDYLRRNFGAVASENTIPFSAELEHTQAYLAVEQAQHEEMLQVEYDTRFTRFRLPPLTLQPIVENAVKHGMDPYAGPLHVSVRTYRADKASVIVVEDNGPGFDPSAVLESPTTLQNIRQRLEWMCGGTLEIEPRSAGGTLVKVTIPD